MSDFDETLPPKREHRPASPDLDATLPPKREHKEPIPEFDMDATIPHRRMRRALGEFSVGDMISGRYQIVSVLGRGAMGMVYRCFDKVAEIEVALKGLPPELVGNDWEMDEIKRNFQLVHNLRHHNIAGYNTLEFDQTSGGYFLVMEYVDGVGLRRYIKDNSPDHTGIIAIISQIAVALDYANNQQILHRDIKPGNIMIDRNGVVKILDFGLAAQIHTSMTKVSMVQDSSGTAPYMSPEQWQGKRQKAASDQYALGVVAYELFAGFLPFEANDMGVLREVVLKETPEPLTNVTPSIQYAVSKALSKNPEDRFPNCTAFAQALTAPVVTVAPVQKSTAKKKFSSTLLITLVVILAVLLCGGIGIWLTTQNSSTPQPVVGPDPVKIPALGETFTVQLPQGKTLEMVRIPNCKENGFMMGSPSGESGRYGDETQHKVYLTQDFYLGRFEVTQEQWQAVMGSNPSYFKGDKRPVENVSYEDALKFCKWLNNNGRAPDGWKFTLPTEAQWEYACRAGTTTPFSYGSRSDTSKMNFDGNYPYGGASTGTYRQSTVEVGSLGYRNAFGLYDMHGNVWEWCLDSCNYSSGVVTDTYNGTQTDPLCTTGSFRVIRGGGWSNSPLFCRSAFRSYSVPAYRNDVVGFRLALVQK